MFISGGKGNYSIRVVSNEPLQIKSNAEWINIPDSLQEDKVGFYFHFSVDFNTSKKQRIGTIVFSAANGYKAVLKIVQKTASLKHIYVKENGSAENKGYDWANATTLKYALAHAITGATIYLAEGTYFPTATITGGDASDDGDHTFGINQNINIIGGFPENISNTDTKPHPEKYPTILSGGSTSYHVVTISAGSSKEEEKVVLKGVVIANGKSDNSSGSVTINGIDYDRANGAGIIIGGGSRVELINCRIVNNVGVSGGGIFLSDASSLKLVDCQLNNNKALSHGGAMYTIGGSMLYIYNSEINSNQSDAVAGGLFIYDNTTAYIYNCFIDENKSGSYGGGLYVRAGSICNVANSFISGNASKSSGGGIFVYDNARLNILSSTITKNSAKRNSGGIYLRNGENIAVIINSIVSGNTQEGNDKQVGVKSDSHPDPIFKASIVGKNVFDKDAMNITTATFDFSNMMNDLGNGVFVPIGATNPALEYGLTGEELMIIGQKFSPPITDGDILAKDINLNERSSTTMGAIGQ